MVKTESMALNQIKNISEHFKLYEFASTSPSPYRVSHTYSNEVKYSTELLDKVEELMSVMEADKAFISSGYRTFEHDRAVGGNGFGQHTTGRAVDICFYKADKPIDNRVVSIIAQDLGFKGIARIGYNGYIHLDMRLIGTYLGDETKGYNTVTKDFRAYYGMSNKDISRILGKTYPQPLCISEGVDYSPVFDYLYYYYKYEDLQRAFGKDEVALFNHFINYGMKEGRQAHKDFDVLKYRDAYIDLREAFGDDLKSYYRHYLDYGLKEGRKG